MASGEPPVTSLASGGPLLSAAQFTLLFLGSAAEGVPLEGHDSIPKEVLEAPRFQREWQDLLAAIALFGPARVALPEYLAASLDLAPLLERGIAEVVVIDTTTELRKRITQEYSEAFTLCRELESLSGFPSAYADGPPTARRREESADIAEEAEHHVARLRRQLQVLTQGLRGIFGYYAEINEAELFQALSSFNIEEGPYGGKDDASPVKPPGDRDLIHLLGLYVRGPEAFEYEVARQYGYGYNPGYLEDFEEVNKGLTERAADFESFAVTSLAFQLFDPAEFLAAHSFWSSFFELSNMIEVAALAGNQLYLPSDVEFSPQDHGVPSDSTAETVRVYQLFLAETGRLPSPRRIDDLERLRRDPGLTSLRGVLANWTELSHDLDEGDLRLAEEIRADIASASRALKRSEYLARVGRVLTYLSVPAEVADLARGSSFGLALMPFGPALEIYQARALRKASWLRFGQP